MSRYGRGIDPLRGSGVNRTIATPGVTATTVFPDRTAADLLGVVGSGIQAAASTVDFLAGAEQIRIQRERADRIAAERAQAEFERANAQTEALQRGEAIDAARLRATTLQGEVQRGEVMLPESADAETIRNTAILFGEDEASRLFPDSPAAREAYATAITQAYAQDVVGQLDAVAKEEQAFAIRRYQSAALVNPEALAEGERNLFPGQPERATLELYLPTAEAYAKAGNVEGLRQLESRVAPLFREQYDFYTRQAQTVQATRQNEQFASTLGVFNQRLNTLQTAALTGRASLSDMQALLQDSDALVQNVDPQYADSARVFSNSVRSLIASTQQEQLQAAVRQGEDAVKAQYLQQAYAISQSGRLSSFVGDRGFEFQSQDGAVKVKLSRDEIISQVRDAQSEALRQQIEADPSIPDGQKPIAYGRGMAKWSAANNVPLTTVLRQTEESFGIVQNALQEGNEQNRDAMLADAARSMEQLKGVFQIRANTLGAENEKTLLFENAILLQENASQIMGKPLTNQEALAMVYNNTRNASVSRESVDRLAQKMADNDGTLFSSAKNGGDVREQIVKNLRVVSVMNPGLSDEKKLEQAKKMFERQGQYLNGYWTPLGYKLQDDYGTDPDTSVARIAEAVASRLKGKAEYVVNGEDITADDIALRRDDKTGQLFFVDMRIGPGRRIFSQDAKLPPSFSDNSLIALMNSDTVARTQAAIKASREVIDEGRPPVGFMGGQR